MDDHEVVRDGVRALLTTEGEISVVAEAGSLPEAIRQAERTKPDLVGRDTMLAEGSGMEATRQIRALRPETQVIMLTSFADEEALYASILAGAAGYVLKQISGGDLVRAIRTVAAGGGLLDPALTRSVLEKLRSAKKILKDEKLASLTPTEERILGLIAEGKTNAEIARQLKLAEKTIKNYVSSILSKLEVARRAEAAAYIARHQATPGAIR